MKKFKLNTVPRVVLLVAILVIAGLATMVVVVSSQDDTVQMRYVGYSLRDAATSSYVTTWREDGSDHDVEMPQSQVLSLQPQMNCLYEFNLDEAGKVLVVNGKAQGRVLPIGKDIEGHDCL